MSNQDSSKLNELAIPEVELLELIGAGTTSQVFKAKKADKTYAVKIAKQMAGQDMSLIFRREAATLARANDPGLTEILEVGDVKSRPYLVMENIEGGSLDDRLNKGALGEKDVLSFLVPLARAIAKLHRLGLVHRDIKPSNIMLPIQGGVKLIDLGFAAQKKTDEDVDRNKIVGTLIYSPPEQTGMLSRPIDGRSDLYSLGIVIFQCLTGKIPFWSNDVGELIRQHATVMAPEVRSLAPEVSPALSLIVKKLMSKDPDDRYQCAEGLLSDLLRLDLLNSELTKSKEITLGQDDDAKALQSDFPLFGREAEVAQLHQLWTQAIEAKNGSTVVIEGLSGCGKTRLTQEILLKAKAEGALILKGKCVKGDPLPFAPLRAALDDYVKKMKRLPGVEKEKAESAFRNAAGQYAPFLKRFSAAFENVFNSAPDVVVTDNRLYYEALSRFLQALCLTIRPTILFVDDVQWSDQATLETIKRLSTLLEGTPILILCTARTEPENATSLDHFNSEMGRYITVHLNLERLSDESLRGLIQSHLGNHPTREDFIKKLVSRSDGNPLVLEEYIRSVFEAGLLKYSWGTWLVDQEKLDRLNLSKSVMELVLGRITAMDSSIIRILQVAALLGNRFRLNLIPKITDADRMAVNNAIAAALSANLIEQNNPGEYTFVHDRVREAILGSINPTDLIPLHQKIAEALDQVVDDSLEHLSALANHYSLGDIKRNPTRVFEVNALVGKKAFERGAAGEAYNFLKKAASVAETEKLNVDRSFMILLAQCCIGTGRHAEAMEVANREMEKTTDRRLLARFYLLLSFSANLTDDTLQTLNYAEKGRKQLHLFSINWRALGNIALYLDFARCLFLAITGIGFGSANGKQKEKYMLLSALYDLEAGAATNTLKPKIERFARLAAFRMGHRLGISREAALGYINFSNFLLRYSARFRFLHKIYEGLCDRSIQLAEQVGDRALLLQVKIEANRARTTDGDFRQSWYAATEYAKSERWMLAISNMRNAGIIAFYNYMSGRAEASIQHSEKMTQFTTPRNMCFRNINNTPILPALAILGRQSEVQKHMTRMGTIWDLGVRSAMRVIGYAGHEIHFYREIGELGKPIEDVIERVNKLGLNYKDFDYFCVHYLMNVAYARLDQCIQIQGQKDRLPAAVKKLREAVGQFRHFSSLPIFRSHYLTVEAGLLRYDGKFDQAFMALEEAEKIANDQDSLWAQYEILRQKAHVCSAQGKKEIGMRNARFAQYFTFEQRWINRMKLITREFSLSDLLAKAGHGHSSSLSRSSDPSIMQSRMASSRMGSTMGSTMGSIAGSIMGASSSSSVQGTMADVSGIGLRYKRQFDALMEVSLASASILDPIQQAKSALDEIARILGAERAFLFMANDTEGTLEMRVARDSEKKDLADATGYSSKVVEKVRSSQKPLVLSGTDEGEVLGSESIVAHNLRSIIAAPLLIRDRLVGVIYLDNRLARGIFTKDDVDILFAIGNHIAIANETARTAKLELEQQALKKDLEAKRAIQIILDNLDQGFMTFDSQGIIQEGVSKIAQNFFGVDPQGKPLMNILQLNDKDTQTYTSWIETLFLELLPFEDLKDMGAKAFEKLNNRYIALDYRPIKAPDGKLEKIILISTDKTNERILEAQAQAEAAMVQMVLSVLKNKKLFINFVQDTRGLFAKLDEEASKQGETSITDLLRYLHTIKGTAASFHLTDLKNLSHHYEDELINARDGGPQAVQTYLPSLLKATQAMRESLDRFLVDNKHVIGNIDETAVKERTLPHDQIDRVAQLLMTKLGANSPEFREYYSTFMLEPMDALFERFDMTVQEVAQKLGKEVELVIHKSPVKVQTERYESMMGAFVHAFRNAVDHGIEAPVDRQKVGKEKKGKIEVQLEKKTSSLLEIVVSDDGNGINPEIIAKIAVKKGLSSEDQVKAMKPEEIIQFVFAEGFSSATEITDISGRGVGLDALRAEVLLLGGKVWVESKVGKGTRFHVQIPVTQEMPQLLPTEKAAA